MTLRARRTIPPSHAAPDGCAAMPALTIDCKRNFDFHRSLTNVPLRSPTDTALRSRGRPPPTTTLRYVRCSMTQLASWTTWPVHQISSADTTERTIAPSVVSNPMGHHVLRLLKDEAIRRLWFCVCVNCRVFKRNISSKFLSLRLDWWTRRSLILFAFFRVLDLPFLV